MLLTYLTVALVHDVAYVYNVDSQQLILLGLASLVVRHAGRPAQVYKE